MIQANGESSACLLRLQAQALEAAANTIVITNCDGAIIWVNHAAEQTYGYSRDEMVGKNPRLFQSGLHDREFYRKLWSTVLAGEVWSGLIFNRTKRGDLIQEQMTITPVSDSDGAPEHFIAIKQNVTEHKRLEEALLLREFAMENSADAVFIARPNGTLVYVNDSACRLLGVNRENLLALELAADHPGQAFAARWQQLREQRSMTWEADFRDPQGEPIPVEISLNYIAKEQCEYACAFVRDVSERRRTEKALRLIVEGTAAKTGREFFRSCARQIALVLDVRYAAVTSIESEPAESEPRSASSGSPPSSNAQPPLNAKMLALWGDNGYLDLDDYTLAGTPCELVVREKERKAYDDVPKQFPAAHALIGMGVVSYEGLPLLDSNGNVIGHLSVMDDQPLGKDPGRESILRIFSARAGAEVERLRTLERLEEARQRADAASEAKGQFLASISHELRTPLNGILGYAQILERDESLSEKQLEAIRVIGSSGEHLLDLINDVLDLSKVEAQKLELEPAAFRLPSFVGIIEKVFLRRAEEKRISFRCELAADLPDIVVADERRLRQVLLNLIDNAIKFTERGHVVLTVTRGSAGVRFEVDDTGPGIDSRELPRLFEPFAQARRKNGHHSGTGLGLAITKRLVELMGGHLEVQTSTQPAEDLQAGSKAGGSCFAFELPLPCRATSEKTAPNARPIDLMQSRITGYRGPRRKLLVVDDRAHNRDLLRSMLEGLGFTVREADSGQTAFDCAEQFQPDAVLMDLKMPDLDGLAATKRLRATAWGANVGVVMLSTGARDFEQSDCRAAGGDAYLSKPIRISELLDTVGRLLDLDWICETPPDDTREEMHLPSSRALGELLALCTVGDVVALREQVDALRKADERYGSFAASLLELLSQFKMKALRERLRNLVAQKDSMA
jgi:PAS domain S-box-containing protein